MDRELLNKAIEIDRKIFNLKRSIAWLESCGEGLLKPECIAIGFPQGGFEYLPCDDLGVDPKIYVNRFILEIRSKMYELERELEML